MKNKILKASISIIFLFGLSSCSLLYKPTTNEATFNRSLEYKFTDSDKTAINNRLLNVEQLLNEDSYSNFYNEFIRIIKGDIYSVATYRNLAQLNYSIYSDSTSQSKYLEVNEYLNTLVKWQESFYKKIYNSKFKDEFFKDYTEDEINKMVGVTLPNEYYELSNENEKLLAEYDKITDVKTSTEVADIYRKLVKNYKLQASYSGYNDYRDYAYNELYERDFNKENTIEFSNYIKKYIVSLYEKKVKSFNSLYENGANKNKRILANFVKGSYTSFMDEFNSYAKEIGGSYYLAYNNLWNNGYYFMGNDSSSDGAYTLYLYNLSTPACYFGPNYQSISTLVHEFGHYYAMLERGNSSGSLDLAETQSQGNELLFLSYLDSNKDRKSVV